MAIDINQLFTQVMEGLGTNTKAKTDIIQQKQDLADQNAGIYEAAMSDILSASQQKLQGDLEAQDRGIATRQALGNDITDPSSVMGIMVQDFREQSMAARAQRDKVASLSSVGFFDSPLEFLMNQVLLPDEQNKLTAIEGKAEAAAKTIQNMQALTTQSAQAARATAKNLTAETVAAAGRTQVAEMTMKLNQLKMESLGYDAEAIQALEASNERLLSLGVQQASYNMQVAAAARAAASHEAQMARLKDEDRESENYIKIVNAGAASMEKKPIDLATAKMMLKSPQTKAQLDKLFLQGMHVMSTGNSAAGATPGEAIMAALETDGLKGQANMPARQFLKDTATEAVAAYEAKNGKVTKWTPEVKSAIASLTDDLLYGPKNPKTGERMEKQGKLYRQAADAEAGIYKAPDLPQLAQIRAIQSNPLYETVIKPAVEAGLTSSSPADLYKQALEAKNRGLITDNQLASGLASLYEASTAYTYASKGLGKFAIPYRPSYVAGVPSVFSPDPSNKDYINWASGDSVMAYHIQSQARLKYSSNYKAFMERNK